jgi:hypothetical protein
VGNASLHISFGCSQFFSYAFCINHLQIPAKFCMNLAALLVIEIWWCSKKMIATYVELARAIPIQFSVGVSVVVKRFD